MSFFSRSLRISFQIGVKGKDKKPFEEEQKKKKEIQLQTNTPVEHIK